MKNLKYLWVFSFLIVAQMISAQTTLEENLKKHIYTLADDSYKGRKAGSDYSVKAAEYIVNQWEEIGIPPYREGNYFQNFREKYRNIIGILQGNDPILKDEYIVVGAHYDHLGYKINNGDTVIYNGADDNASGVAALIELSRKLKENQSSLRRSVVFVAFDAEEIGLFGSVSFIASSIVPINKIKLMLSVDMVGWLRESGKLKYEGVGTIAGGKDLVLNPKLIPAGLNVDTKSFENSLFTATDTQAFAAAGIPTLAVTTGLKSPYHKPEDDADLIDYNGLALVTEHLKNIVETVSQDTDYKASGKIAAKHKEAPQKFEFGLSANAGSNYHEYTTGTLNGKPAIFYSAGFLAQFNFGKFYALRSELIYDHTQAKHPAGTVKTNGITIPVNFVLQTPKSLIMADVFVGGYYSYKFGGKQGNEKIDFSNLFYRNEAGLNYGVSIGIRHIKIGITDRYGLTNLTRYKNAGDANIRNRTQYFTLTYLF
ncbi:MAG: M20/M25/M40 family metallo-hydrolase [Dysgonamonadaceae bacterium]|jgi:hypothetical protein|nr:M20/M25/M40 family metallo-hydrolase [Dysgonamonadaceae bacterium]